MAVNSVRLINLTLPIGLLITSQGKSVWIKIQVLGMDVWMYILIIQKSYKGYNNTIIICRNNKKRLNSTPIMKII